MKRQHNCTNAHTYTLIYKCTSTYTTNRLRQKSRLYHHVYTHINTIAKSGTERERRMTKRDEIKDEVVRKNESKTTSIRKL